MSVIHPVWGILLWQPHKLIQQTNHLLETALQAPPQCSSLNSAVRARTEGAHMFL